GLMRGSVTSRPALHSETGSGTSRTSSTSSADGTSRSFLNIDPYCPDCVSELVMAPSPCATPHATPPATRNTTPRSFSPRSYAGVSLGSPMHNDLSQLVDR